MLQLSRYEREVNHAHRSAIKIIQERDAPSTRPMVLCVCAIVDSNGPEHAPELDLTDGWYRIRATYDGALAKAVDKGTIKIGSKIAISGARVSVSCILVSDSHLTSYSLKVPKMDAIH
jgi:breast cancer 2 susceptibility protein